MPHLTSEAIKKRSNNANKINEAFYRLSWLFLCTYTRVSHSAIAARVFFPFLPVSTALRFVFSFSFYRSPSSLIHRFMEFSLLR